MREERLQEIKDSVDFQREMLLARNLGTLCVDEEQELIDEIERLKEQLNDEIDDELKQSEIMVKQQKEIERLTAESTKWESKFYDEAKKVDRAIEYIEKNSYTTIETIDDINYFIVRLDKCPDLLDILKGDDKE